MSDINFWINDIAMMLLIILATWRLEFYLRQINDSLFEVRRSLLDLEEQKQSEGK